MIKYTTNKTLLLDPGIDSSDADMFNVTTLDEDQLTGNTSLTPVEGGTVVELAVNSSGFANEKQYFFRQEWLSQILRSAAVSGLAEVGQVILFFIHTPLWAWKVSYRRISEGQYETWKVLF